MRYFLPLVAAVVTWLCCPIHAAIADELQEATRLYRQGNKGDAQTRLTAFLNQNPKDVRGRFLQGVIYTEQKRTNEALKIFTGLTEDHPELPEPYNNLAVLYASQGQFDKARKALETSIRTHPSYAIAHENLGDIYATLASQAYDRALQLDGANTAARSKLELIKELVPKTTMASAQIKPDAEPAPLTPAKEPVKPAKPEPPVKVEPEKPAKPEPDKPAKPEPEKPAKPTVPADASGDVLKAVHAWAKAWSSNDAERYLSFYAPDFRTPNGEPRAKWEAGRRERLAKPRRIEVGVLSPRVSIGADGQATVSFRQQYRSDALKASGDKTLKLIKRGERWLIQREDISR